MLIMQGAVNIVGCIFGKWNCGGSRDTKGILSADGRRGWQVCLVSTEDDVDVSGSIADSDCVYTSEHTMFL